LIFSRIALVCDDVQPVLCKRDSGKFIYTARHGQSDVPAKLRRHTEK